MIPDIDAFNKFEEHNRDVEIHKTYDFQKERKLFTNKLLLQQKRAEQADKMEQLGITSLATRGRPRGRPRRETQLHKKRRNIHSSFEESSLESSSEEESEDSEESKRHTGKRPTSSKPDGEIQVLRGRGRPKGISTLIKEKALKQEQEALLTAMAGTKRPKPEPSKLMSQILETRYRRGRLERKPKTNGSDYCDDDLGTDDLLQAHEAIADVKYRLCTYLYSIIEIVLRRIQNKSAQSALDQATVGQ